MSIPLCRLIEKYSNQEEVTKDEVLMDLQRLLTRIVNRSGMHAISSGQLPNEIIDEGKVFLVNDTTIYPVLVSTHEDSISLQLYKE